MAAPKENAAQTARIIELEAQLAAAQDETNRVLDTNAALISEGNELRQQIEDLKAAAPVAVPEGFVLMPIVPDEEMMLADSDDQESAWDSDATCRAIRRRVLQSVTNVLIKRQNADTLAQG